MHIALWIVQGLLAFVFLFAGATKLSQPRDKLAANMAWVEDFSDSTVKGIGAAEVVAGLALILPPLLGAATVLTPLAAAGLVVLMAAAAATHNRRRETQMIPINAVLLVLAAFVAWGRFGPHAF